MSCNICQGPPGSHPDNCACPHCSCGAVRPCAPEPKIGTRYAWYQPPRALVRISDNVPICGRQLDCGGPCALEPGHTDPCTCGGDTDGPGTCPA